MDTAGQPAEWSEELNHAVHQAVTVADAQANRANRPRRPFTISIGDIDLPAYVSGGVVYIQAPLPHILKAVGAHVSDILSGVEARVSVARSGALPSAGDGGPVHRPRVAKPRVVPDSRQQ